MALRKAYFFGLVAIGSVAVAPAFIAVGCKAGQQSLGGGGSGTNATGVTGTGGASTGTGTTGSMTTATGFMTGASSSTGLMGDPTTCADAAMYKTYLGCDFWPTVTANNVWSIFDFTAVVANAGAAPAMVTVTGNGVNTTVTVAPNSLQKIYLPWVKNLKGNDSDTCGTLVSMTSSVKQTGGAYHLVSSVPVTVYQFSALEYQGKTGNGPAGKNWSSCPGNQICPQTFQPQGCYSFTNDASLLLPSTAMTGNYRVTSQADWSLVPEGAFFAITGTEANTTVKVYVAPGGHVVAGNGVPDTPGGGMMTLTLNAGDVAELVGSGNGDLAGSLIKADKPVQVISGMPCAYQPFKTNTPCNVPSDCPTGACYNGTCLDPACDHLEQSVFPAETLGKHYFIAPPTSPHNTVVGHVVRLVGNVNGTNITYPSGNKPAGAPTTLNAGQVADLGIVAKPFEIQGDHEFAVATFMLGASLTDPNNQPPNQLGDPSQSNIASVEQYRVKYVFLAPTDYTESYVDIIEPMNAGVMLDGAAAGNSPTPIGSGYGIARVLLGPGVGGAHVLTASQPVGIQVIGYGSYTSYQYPGGLNLDVIAPPPPPPM